MIHAFDDSPDLTSSCNDAVAQIQEVHHLVEGLQAASCESPLQVNKIWFRLSLFIIRNLNFVCRFHMHVETFLRTGFQLLAEVTATCRQKSPFWSGIGDSPSVTSQLTVESRTDRAENAQGTR